MSTIGNTTTKEIVTHSKQMEGFFINLNRPAISAVGVIVGLGALFGARSTSLQRIGSALVIGSILKMHRDFENAKKAMSGSLNIWNQSVRSLNERGLKQIVSTGWEKAHTDLENAIKAPIKPLEKALETGSYFVAGLLLVESHIVLKVVLLISSGMYIKNIYDRCSFVKPNLQEYVQKLEGAALDQTVLAYEEISFEQSSRLLTSWNHYRTAEIEVSRYKKVGDYEKARKLNPDSLVILEGLIRAYLSRNQQGDVAKAQECLARMKQISPSLPEITNLEREIGKKNSSNGSFFPIEEDEQLQDLSLYNLGQQALSEGFFEEAYNQFVTAYEQDQNPSTSIRAGYSLLQYLMCNRQQSNLGLFNQARKYITNAYRQIESKTAFDYMAYAEIMHQDAAQILSAPQRQEGDLERFYALLSSAKEAIMKALELNEGELPFVFRHLGGIVSCYVKAGESIDHSYFRGVIPILQKMLQLQKPEDQFSTHQQLGNVYRNLEENETSLAHYLQAHEIDATDSVIVVQLADVSKRMGQYSEARQYLAQAEKLGYDMTNVQGLLQELVELESS